MFTRKLDFLKIANMVSVLGITRFFLQHFAVTNDRIERSAQFVTHVRKEYAFGAACLLSHMLGIQQFFLRLLTLRNLFFQLESSHLQLVVRTAQRAVTLLNVG